jgi:hypothetical protein
VSTRCGGQRRFSSSAGKRETNNNNKAKKKKTKFFNFSWLELVGFDFISHDTTVWERQRRTRGRFTLIPHHPHATWIFIAFDF